LPSPASLWRIDIFSCRKSAFASESCPIAILPMGCTIDHLSVHRRVTVLRDFTDAVGSTHHAGETAVISRIELDWPKRQIHLEWEREGIRESLVFDLTATSGPGNGRMREYFEAGDLAIPNEPEKRFVPGIGVVSTLAPELPPLSVALIVDLSRWEEGLERVHALAGHKRFDEAEEQLRALSELPPDLIATALAAAAERHAFDPETGIYEWLRERAINHWYSWGARATSGGDGTARLLDIYPAMERFKQLDRARQGLGLANPEL
ncbi:MAG: hypothetical protein ABL994_22390, partial [Verrucomicrobiales bacterium]